METGGLYKEWLDQAESLGFQPHRYGQIGTQPLIALTREAEAGKPHIYVSAGIHGDEPAGVLALLELYKSAFFDSRAAWFLCPLLNPTGLELGTRGNAEGRDLNRDYRHPQTVEVQSHRAWLEAQVPFHLALSLHEDWETTGFYLYEINTSARNCIGPAVLERVSAVMEIETGTVLDQHEVTSQGYIYHPPEADAPENWPEAIFHVKRCPLLSCTFETPSVLPMEQRVHAHVTAVKAAIDLFLADFC